MASALGQKLSGDYISNMEIADGLKELLISHGFTRSQILSYTTEESASTFEIDQYFENIILNAAKLESI